MCHSMDEDISQQKGGTVTLRWDSLENLERTETAAMMLRLCQVETCRYELRTLWNADRRCPRHGVIPLGQESKQNKKSFEFTHSKVGHIQRAAIRDYLQHGGAQEEHPAQADAGEMHEDTLAEESTPALKMPEVRRSPCTK